MRIKLIGAVSVLALGLVVFWPGAAVGATAQPIPPRMACASLATPNAQLGAPGFPTLPGPPFLISAAADLTTDAGAVYCQVKGTISPQTHFELQMPENNWHGDYVQEGCGGFCGAANLNLQPASSLGCAPVANGEVALAIDDQGHTGVNGGDGTWAAEDPMLRVVFGYRSEHDLALAAKSIITAYYGQGPSFAYFDGCSDGWHEALDVVQRYPTDFNGVLAIAPAHNWAPLLGVYQTWMARMNMDAGGKQILDPSKLPALHAAVMQACADSDGIIMDPRTCTFDPATLTCPAGTDDPTCLTPPQVEMARKAYRGPTDPDGRNLFDGGVAYGSELAWTPWFVGPADDPSAPFSTTAGRFGAFYLKYMAYWDNPPPTYTIQSFEFTDQAYQDLLGLQGIYAANNTNLQPFRDAGGKLIIVHGWSDQAISPWSTINYYAGVADFMGGFEATQSFSRLYMVPGGYHCFGGGDPFTRGDFLTPLINWVENGQAPDALTVPVAPAPTNTTTLTSVTVQPFNPLVKPAANGGLNSSYDYIGANTTYTPDNQAWCEQQGTQLVCATRRTP